MYFATDDRKDLILRYFREMDNKGVPVHLEGLLQSVPLSRKTAWKALQCLIEDGAIEKRDGKGVKGHARGVYVAEEYWLMPDDLRERYVVALERIATAMETNNRIRKRKGVNTDNVRTLDSYGGESDGDS